MKFSCTYINTHSYFYALLIRPNVILKNYDDKFYRLFSSEVSNPSHLNSLFNTIISNVWSNSCGRNNSICFGHYLSMGKKVSLKNALDKSITFLQLNTFNRRNYQLCQEFAVKTDNI